MDQTVPKYLLVKHSRGWNVDRCCVWLDQHQIAYDWFYPLECDQFPNVSDYAGVIIYGGASSANDDRHCDWIGRELAFVEQILQSQTAFFGICLGAQMLARVLGSSVLEHPQAEKEVGFSKVYPTTDSGEFLIAEQHFMQWHSEGFDLPGGCNIIATGQIFPNQAFRYSHNVVGVQFHPEINPQALAIWHERNRLNNPNPLTQSQRNEQMQDAHLHDAAISDWLNNFLQRWTDSHTL